MRRVGSTPSSDDSGEKYVDYDTEHYISDDSYSETETLGGAGNQITTEEFASNLRQAGIHKANQELYRKLIRTFKKVPIEQKADFIKQTQSMVNKTQNMEQYKKFGTEMGMDAQEFQENLTDFIERPLTSQNEILRGMQQALERDQSSFVTENIPVSSTETSTTELSSIRPINRIPNIDLAEAGPSGTLNNTAMSQTNSSLLPDFDTLLNPSPGPVYPWHEYSNSSHATESGYISGNTNNIAINEEEDAAAQNKIEDLASRFLYQQEAEMYIPENTEQEARFLKEQLLDKR